jgi:hypothetical protein
MLIGPVLGTLSNRVPFNSSESFHVQKSTHLWASAAAWGPGWGAPGG